MKQELIEYSLPRGWVAATLNEVSRNIEGGSQNPSLKQETASLITISTIQVCEAA